jgi:hypothetical protein
MPFCIIDFNIILYICLGLKGDFFSLGFLSKSVVFISDFCCVTCHAHLINLITISLLVNTLRTGNLII